MHSGREQHNHEQEKEEIGMFVPEQTKSIIMSCQVTLRYKTLGMMLHETDFFKKFMSIL